MNVQIFLLFISALTYVVTCICVFSEDDKHYNFVHYFIIVLGVSTLGTSILLWLLYKKLIKQCIGKDKHDVQGIFCSNT